MRQDTETQVNYVTTNFTQKSLIYNNLLSDHLYLTYLNYSIMTLDHWRRCCSGDDPVFIVSCFASCVLSLKYDPMTPSVTIRD